MDTKSMIMEIVVIAIAIILPFTVLALSYWGKKLEKNGCPQNLLTRIGMMFLESLEVVLLFLAKVFSLLLTGEWSYVNQIVASAEENEDHSK